MKLSVADIQTIKDYFGDKPVLRAYLFGSFSRNEAENDSDIDILVDLDYTKNIGMDFIVMKLDLEQILNKRVDLVSSEAISRHFSPFINADKKLIYEK